MRNLFLANLKLAFRDRQLLFWSLAFPLIFIVIFGLFFSSSAPAVGTVVLVNQASTSLSTQVETGLRNTPGVKVRLESDESVARKLIDTGRAAGGIVIPAGFGAIEQGAPTKLTLYFDTGNEQAHAVLLSVVNSVLTNASFERQEAKQLFSVENVRVSRTGYSYFDFILVGLVGMSLMQSSILGLSVAMAKYREEKILKRITTTPLASWKFMVAEVAARLVMNAAQVLVILAVGIGAFHGKIHGNIPALVAVALLGAVLFQLVGFFVASVTRTIQAAEGMSISIAIPMMFLSGVFFPIDQLPRWLQGIVQYLPLAPLLRIMRGVALERMGFAGQLGNLTLVLAWVLVMMSIVVYRFRLNEDD